MTIRWRQMMGMGFGILALSVAGCEERDLTVPTESEAQAYFAETPGVTVEVGGNVVVVKVNQPYEQLRRGGALWARVGPYVYLFSTTTEQLFKDFGGLGGVRVTTSTGSRQERVATALLAEAERRTGLRVEGLDLVLVPQNKLVVVEPERERAR